MIIQEKKIIARVIEIQKKKKKKKKKNIRATAQFPVAVKLQSWKNVIYWFEFSRLLELSLLIIKI